MRFKLLKFLRDRIVRNILLLLPVCLILFVPGISHASIVEIPATTNDAPIIGWSGLPAGTIATTTFWVRNDYIGSSAANIVIRNYTCNYTGISGSITYYPGDCSNTILSENMTWSGFTTTGQTAIVNGHNFTQYQVWIAASSTPSMQMFFNGGTGVGMPTLGDTNLATVGTQWNTCQYSGGFRSCGAASVLVNFDGLYPPEPPPPVAPTIAFFFPANGTTTPDSPGFQWQILGNNLSQTSTYRVDVFYSRPGSSQTWDDFNITQAIATSSVFVIPKTQGLIDPSLGNPQTWYAYAYLSVCANISTCAAPVYAGIPIATSSAIEFYVSAIGGTTSSTLANPTTDCTFTTSSFLGDPVGNMQNALCNAFVFLFYPNASEQGDLTYDISGEQSLISTKPPFGYFSIVSTALSSLNESDTTTQLMSTSTYAAMSAVFNPVKIGIGVLFGLMFTFWLIWRIGKIEF